MRSRKIVHFMVIIALIVTMLIITLVIIFSIASENKKGFTELYFLNGLPKAVEANKEYNFSFAIRNLEKKNMDYYYIVNEKPNEIKQGYVNLNHGEIEIINQKFLVSNKTESPMKISVQLLNKDQEIHFWVGSE